MKNKINLQTTVGGVELRNPVLLASGTCGYGSELAGQLDFRAIGGLIAKSVTLKPRPGNPMPRVAECTAGMLNAIGLANVGVEAFCREKLPAMRQLPCALLANAAGSSPQEYLQVVERLNLTSGLAGLEINVSCPNVPSGGIEFGRDPKILAGLVSKIRQRTKLPLWIKLSPNVTDMVPLALAAQDAGADALTVMNTLIGMRMDISQRRPLLAHRKGGLSGPAIKPIALYWVYQVAGAVKIPVVACGGIETTEDALEFILAGAQAVQIGTATFRNPRAAVEVAKGLAAYGKQTGLSSWKALVGAGRV